MMPETYTRQHSPASDAVHGSGAAPKTEDIKDVDSIQDAAELNSTERNVTDLLQEKQEGFKSRQIMPDRRRPVVRKFENRILQMNQHHTIIDGVVNTDSVVYDHEVTDDGKIVSRDDDHKRLTLGEASKTGTKVLTKPPAADNDLCPFPVAFRTATEKHKPQKLHIPNVFH